MALMTCADCGARVSKKAETCPGCGRQRPGGGVSAAVVLSTVILGLAVVGFMLWRGIHNLGG